MRHPKQAAKPFKPNPDIKGGSKKGKAYLPWPIKSIAFADGLIMGWKGGDWDTDRRGPPLLEFMKMLDARAPWILDCRMEAVAKSNHKDKSRKAQADLLKNRVYKGHYDGTSSRGSNHDPNTRASTSREFWRSKCGSNIVEVYYERGLRGMTCPEKLP